MRIAGKATKGKGKRWTKGGSSSCNPNTNKHRLHARTGTSVATHSPSLPPHPPQSSLRLSPNVLHQHNLTQLQKLGLDDRQSLTTTSNHNTPDDESIGGQSFASVWTNCSNVSFNKLLLGFDSSSAIHKQMLSVLAAITETITSNGGQQSETEYFAALMTCLENVDTEETLTAVLCLIQMVIKRLPPNVIRLKFSETSKVFVDYLAKYIKGDNGMIAESLTNSLATLLQHQEFAVWELSSTKNIFEIILSLTVHNKPRIRKCSQRSIARILKTNINQSKTSLCHPIAKLTADFCIRKLEDHGTNDDINSTLYVLNLLTDILSVLPNAGLKKCCEAILTQMTFGNVLIVSTAFKAFYVMFSANPHQDILTPDLNAKLISALYDYQPNINDSQPLCAWVEAIRQGFLNLYRINKKLCFNHLPKLFNTLITCLLSDSKEVHLNVTNNLKQIYSQCIQSSCLEIDQPIIERVYSSVEKSLQYEYFNAYIPIFQLISKLLNENFKDFTANIITKLITIRDSYDNVYASNVDRTIGRAVQVFGPKFVVTLCPLDLNEDNTDVSHNWLIPVIRDNTKGTELAFFIDHFLPIATTLLKTCKKLETDGNIVTAKTCAILLSQIWSLLPSFCNQPNDFDKSFKRIAKMLGDLLSTAAPLRRYVLSAFRNISKGLETPLGDTFRTELSRFAKNFIPILFNIYTNEENESKNQRNSVYEIIEIFFSVADNSLLISLHQKIAEKLQNCESNPFMRQSLMDLIRAFIPYLGREELNQIYTQLVIAFIGDNKLITEQKKAFRILGEICRNESNVCKDFMATSLSVVLNLLIESLSKCLSSSKSFALKALIDIISNNENLNNKSIEWKNILLEIMTKTLNCFLINSRKVKTTALDLIISIANAYKSLDSGDVNNHFFETMISFMKNSEYPTSAVIVCLTRLYQDFRNEIPKHIECDLIENMITSLGSENRQIIQSSLDFVKYFFKTASLDQLSTYLELLISNLSNINRRHKNHFRMKIKEMFVRLVRKYGYVMVSKMIPEEYRKVLKNIRKVEERKKRFTEDNESDGQTHITSKSKTSRKEFEDIIANSSDEESENEDQMTNVSHKDLKSWMKDESNDNEIIDLLSTKMSQNILHKDPEIKPKEKKELFETTSDGKLVIEDLDKPKRGTKRRLEGDERMDLDQDDDMDGDVVSNKQSVKTSHSRQSGYRTGGKGIHRNVNKEFGEEYKSNKAKGDMKRKGRPDPFAYIPLNRQTLNKRKKAKLSGRFNNLVNAARKGAKVGTNKKSKKARKN